MNRLIHPQRFFLVALAVTTLAGRASAEQIEMHDAATHEQLARTLRMAEQADPMKSLKPSTGADPSVATRPSILRDSDIVCFHGLAALVPKRAILQIPKNLADRLKFVEGAHLMGWTDFYAQNCGWITTVEVSRSQAEGNAPLSDETHKVMVATGNLVVATYHGGPISILPLKPTAIPQPSQP